MSDRMTQEQLHRCMSRIRGRDTGPELLVRRFLWRHGYRYRLYDKRLPGRPDIIMRKWRTVIFVNGCFWHGHDCEMFKMPKSNVAFWEKKIETNRKRDRLNIERLTRMGFRVITIWECELSKKRREATLESLLYTMSQIVLEESGARVYSVDDEMPLAAETETAYGSIKSDN